ncbi:heterokaryon incompatibility protein-domain-containing protein [Nemania sp. FL0031]|nr:heterokaryon incompatibility protein-domain-containing protein [Nemania sp. FL0031]
MSLDHQLYYEPFYRETRLATILPGQWNDHLRCSLTHVPIDSARRPIYKALSYVWGSPNVTEDIIVNGQNQKITLNLACAIRHLRSLETPVKLWIDALCINQDSASEKNTQVALMRDIYAGAEEVIVFLGDGVNHRISKAYVRQPLPPPVVFYNDSRDYGHLQLFGDSPNPKFKGNTWNAFKTACLVRTLSQPNDYHYARAVIEGGGTRGRQEIFELLRRLLVEPWWQRIWVVQEVAIPPKVTIRYGNVTAPWNMFVQAAEVIKSQDFRLSNDAGYVKVLSLFTRQVLDIENLRTKWEIERGTDLLSLLQRFSERKATDERDKIYALLGLAKEEGLLIPDYSVDIQEVYGEATIALIKNYHNLAIFSGDLKRKNNKSLASWIPDWSAIFTKSDHERVALQSVYNACSHWRIAVFETMDEYWINVAKEMELLVRDLRKSSSEPRKLTIQLRGALVDYKKIIESEWIPFTIRPLASQAVDTICQLCTKITELTQEDHFQPRLQIAEMKELFSLSAIFSGNSIGLQILQKNRTELMSNGPWPFRILKPGGSLTTEYDLCWEEGRPYRHGTLRIESRFVTKVRWRGTKLNTWDDTDSGLLTVGEWMGEVPDLFLHHQSTTRTHTLGQETRQRFARTLVGGIYLRAGGIDRIRLGDDVSLAQWFESCLLPQVRRVCSIEFSIESIKERGYKLTKSFDTEMRLATEGRVFFQTYDGGMGLGPASMTAEDEIHILPGGQTHFVLRRRPDSKPNEFELIGDCFLDLGGYETIGKVPLRGSLPWEILGPLCIKRGLLGDGRCDILLK